MTTNPPGYVTPEMARRYQLRRLYGVTPEQYDAILEDQDDGCAICGIAQDVGGKRLPIDHNHLTGLNRGILCQSCNRGLGHFKDDVALLLKAAEYLTFHAEITQGVGS